VIECDPTDSVEVASEAVPPLTAAVPREFTPSKNCIVPEAAFGDTVAVNVTLYPNVEGFAFEDSVVLVAALFRVCKTGGEVHPPNVESPS